jgi:subtilisin family serine protease
MTERRYAVLRLPPALKQGPSLGQDRSSEWISKIQDRSLEWISKIVTPTFMRYLRTMPTLGPFRPRPSDDFYGDAYTQANDQVRGATIGFVSREDIGKTETLAADAVAIEMPVTLISQSGQTPPASQPWGLEAIGATQSPYSGAGVTVAVLDTGIELDHPAFTGLIREENCEDFTGTRNVRDTHGHGTHCAGILFGHDINGLRIGVARGVTNVLIAKVFNNNLECSTLQILDALQWAVKKGADIVCLSLGIDFIGHVRKLQLEGMPNDLAISRALEHYRDNLRLFDKTMSSISSTAAFGRPSLIVAAVGNDSRPAYRIGASLPASAEGVLAIGAVERTLEGKLVVPDFSNADPRVCAPGVGILSAALEGKTDAVKGTSYAAPHAAGIAALWWEKLRREDPNVKPRDVEEKLVGSASSQDFESSFVRRDRGAGIVKAPQ